jgi:EAL domain-containing protein (putative c-di-GMP-specific phosphodiesterase class I)
MNDDSEPDLAADLAAAIAHDELSLFFQPVVDLTTGATAGYEMLLRCFHRTAGQIHPERIVRLAAEGGLADELIHATLTRAAEAAAQWLDPAFVALNILASRLARPDLATSVQAILARVKLPAERLIVQVTGHEPIPDVAAARRTIAALRAAGIAVALDTFGQAHANLAAIEAGCFDKLKLDCAFASSGPDCTAGCSHGQGYRFGRPVPASLMMQPR